MREIAPPVTGFFSLGFQRAAGAAGDDGKTLLSDTAITPETTCGVVEHDRQPYKGYPPKTSLRQPVHARSPITSRAGDHGTACRWFLFYTTSRPQESVGRRISRT